MLNERTVKNNTLTGSKHDADPILPCKVISRAGPDRVSSCNTTEPDACRVSHQERTEGVRSPFQADS